MTRKKSSLSSGKKSRAARKHKEAVNNESEEKATQR